MLELLPSDNRAICKLVYTQREHFHRNNFIVLFPNSSRINLSKKPSIIHSAEWLLKVLFSF